MEKTIRTSRRVYDEKSHNSIQRQRRQNTNKGRIEETEYNGFTVRLTICVFAVVFVFIVSNIDSDITNKISNEIKGVVSENISAENVRDIFHEISYVFSQKQENDVLETKQNENSEVLPSEEEFRIDENILEQMNDEKK